MTIRHLRLIERTDILLAVMRFPSKIHWSDDSQIMECVTISNEIKKAEEHIGHRRTILLGDLNMNPFEAGVVSANGLHAVMARHIAKKQSRVIQEKEYPFFYNPMWSFMGDTSPGPSGTYYYQKAEHKVFFWNTFDQVMIRSGLLDSFDSNDVRILDSDGITSFMNAKGIPNYEMFSDHLPVYFKLRI